MTGNANNGTKRVGNPDGTATIPLDAKLRTFLRSVRNGQSINLAAWAAKVLAAGRISETDVARCAALGFAG